MLGRLVRRCRTRWSGCRTTALGTTGRTSTGTGKTTDPIGREVGRKNTTPHQERVIIHPGDSKPISRIIFAILYFLLCLLFCASLALPYNVLFETYTKEETSDETLQNISTSSIFAVIAMGITPPHQTGKDRFSFH